VRRWNLKRVVIASGLVALVAILVAGAAGAYLYVTRIGLPAKVVPPEGIAFLSQHALALDIAGDGARFSAPVLDPLLAGKRAIFLGEAHGIAENEALDLALLKHLHKTAGVRYYMAEAGYAASRLVNEYVQTGDEQLLRDVYAGLKGTLAWNREQFEFWRKVRAWNQALPEVERVQVIGLDVEHQYQTGVAYLQRLLPPTPPPQSISPTVSALIALVIENPHDADAVNGVATALLQDVEARRADYAAYLGDRLFDVEMTARGLRNRFEYYAMDDNNDSLNARDRMIYESFLQVYDHFPPGGYYGKWGMDHAYQRPRAAVNRVAVLMNGMDSPVAGNVLTLVAFYRNCSSLGTRNGEYISVPCAPDETLVKPLAQAAAGDVTLFRLDGQGSPFERDLYLVNNATGGGVTTDYFQAAILFKNASAASALREP
jgi:hypothetical protein